MISTIADPIFSLSSPSNWRVPSGMNPCSNFASFVLRFLESLQVSPSPHLCEISMGIKARGRGKKALFGRRGGKWQDFAGLAEDFMWSKHCVIWGGGHSERKRGDRLQFPDYETHRVTQLKTQKKKHEHSCRLWDTHSREHTLSHSWRYTVLKSHRHTILQKLRNRDIELQKET